MEKLRLSPEQLDLFIFSITDFKFRDQRETMERPFFSLSKSKRLKPIEYQNDAVWVRVEPHQNYGMATIWDADILIWAASRLADLRNRGVNDIPDELHFHPYDLLKAIKRDVGGDQYKRLQEALMRLKTTNIETNIRAPKGKKTAAFSWISEVRGFVDENDEIKGMSIVLSKWFRDGVLQQGGILSIDPAYFAIKGGRERWLYRVARKHAGGNGLEGFAIPLPTLFEKSGAEGTYRRFKFELNAIVRRNALPGIRLQLQPSERGEPVLWMVMDDGTIPLPAEQAVRKRPRAQKAKSVETRSTQGLPLFQKGLSDEIISRIRSDFPGWDVYALKSEFDQWVATKPAAQQPKDYEAAFYGFVRTHHKKHN